MSKKVVFFLITFLILGMQFAKAQKSEENKHLKITQLTPQQAMQLLENKDAIMIDVREIEELKIISYDVDTIINIPLSNFEMEFERQSKSFSKNKRLIIVCRSGRRSQKAAQILLAKEYSQIYNLKGGIIEWERQKMKVKK
ncbi:rhodanese-like domain-containing protein [Bernardetia litoralis]|uniref:rhodanese-like domain-containing protein n=1 Tax=Bernardetia litoralis TaxID=999 RepID=UPI0012FD83F0|nr:rhodanese-like domain-containing protein [Bernardetia litoralis]